MYFARHIPIVSSPTPEDVFNGALEEYTRHTGNDLAEHPLSSELENCRTASDVLVVLEKLVKTFREPRGCNKKLAKVLEPTVNVVYSLSGAFGGLVRPLEVLRLRRMSPE